LHAPGSRGLLLVDRWRHLHDWRFRDFDGQRHGKCDGNRGRRVVDRRSILDGDHRPTAWHLDGREHLEHWNHLGWNNLGWDNLG